jgi:hypothetical protein
LLVSGHPTIILTPDPTKYFPFFQKGKKISAVLQTMEGALLFRIDARVSQCQRDGELLAQTLFGVRLSRQFH